MPEITKFMTISYSHIFFPTVDKETEKKKVVSWLRIKTHEQKIEEFYLVKKALIALEDKRYRS